MNMRIDKKKSALILGLMIAVVLSLSACGSKDVKEDTKTTEDTIISGKIDVKYTNNDLDGSWDESEATKVTLDDSYTISKAGTYVFSGTLKDGQIIVKAGDLDKVKIVLNNVSITCKDGPGILVETGDKVFITLAEGSENSVADGATYASTEDQPWGAIFSKSDLTINGAGQLSVEGNANNGIVSKDDLRITGGTIAIKAVKNGIRGKDSVGILDGNVTISAENDGIKSNDTAADKGYVSIDGGVVKISDVTSQGIDATYVAQITGGTLDIKSNNEGIQGKVVYISDGEVNVEAKDDGLNGTDGSTTQGAMDSSQEGTYIEIAGGIVNVTTGADGIDSNGDFTVSGGTTTVQGPENGGNGSIDYQGTGTITGGTFIAMGSSQMAQNFSDDSKQCVLMYNGEEYPSGTKITLTDADGKEIVTSTSKVKFSSIVISSPDMVKGETYTLNLGGTTETIEMSSTIVTKGDTAMTGSGPGGMRGGGRPEGMPK